MSDRSERSLAPTIRLISVTNLYLTKYSKQQFLFHRDNSSTLTDSPFQEWSNNGSAVNGMAATQVANTSMQDFPYGNSRTQPGVLFARRVDGVSRSIGVQD